MQNTLQQSLERHCLFRTGQAYFALPARTVREVSIRPKIVSVPGAAAVLAGVCHFRNEFLPTLSLRPLVSNAIADHSSESQIVVVDEEDGAWALLVDEVISLEPLEAALATETLDDDAWSEAIIGWATYRDHSVRIIDPEALYNAVADVLQTAWASMASCRDPQASDDATEQPQLATQPAIAAK